MIVIISVLIAFLCGSIPTGYIITRRVFNIDIREQGSGNIGSTNVKRVVGSKASLMTQIVDITKGIVPIVLAMIVVANDIEIGISKDLYFAIVAVAVILGHDYTPFLKFKGGKGVNTTLGAFILLAPIPTLSGCAVHVLLKFVTKIVSIRSIMLGITIPVVCYITGKPIEITIGAIVAAIIMIIKHKDNLKRLINGEEK